MPPAFRPVTRRGVAGGLAAAAFLLTACGGSSSPPPPSVTVTVGTSVTRVGASAYLQGGTLRSYDRTAPILQVKAGAAVDVEVESPVARAGWIVAIDKQVSGVQHGLVHRVTVPDLGKTGVGVLNVYQAPQGEQEKASGSWTFLLARVS